MKILPALGASLMLGLTGHAQTNYYWSGAAGDGSYATAGNWSLASSNAIPVASAYPTGITASNLVFNVSPLNGNETITTPYQIVVRSVVFANSGTTAITNSAGTSSNQYFEIGAGGVTVSAGAGAVTLAGTNVVLLAASQLWSNNSSSLLTVAGRVQGPDTITLAGAGAGGTLFSGILADETTPLKKEAIGPPISSVALGSLSLVIATSAGTTTLTGANTYSGGTTLSAGTLALGSANTLKAATGALRVNGGTLLTTVTATTLGGNLSLTDGMIDLNGSAAGTLTLAAGKNLAMSGGTIDFSLGTASDRIASAGSGSLSITGGTLALGTTGAGFSYTSAYQLFDGFSAGSFGSATITGYDSTHYLASLSSAGVLSFSAVAIPEPASLALIAGALGLALAARRRRLQRSPVSANPPPAVHPI